MTAIKNLNRNRIASKYLAHYINSNGSDNSPPGQAKQPDHPAFSSIQLIR